MGKFCCNKPRKMQVEKPTKMLVKMLATEVLLSLVFLGDDTDKGSFLFVTALVKLKGSHANAAHVIDNIQQIMEQQALKNVNSC